MLHPKRIVPWWLLVLLALGAHAATSAAQSLIPRSVLFGNPDKASPKLSPDGTKLTYLAAKDGVLNVWLAPANNGAAARPITDDKKRGIRNYGWGYDPRYLAYIQDKNGDENWHIYVVNVATNEVRDITPIDGVQARFQHVSPKFPTEALIAINDRDPRLHDIYRVNLETGERRLLLQNEGFADFVTDDDFNVRFAMRTLPGGGQEVLERAADGGWKPFATVGPEDSLTTRPAGFDATGKVLYMIDSRNRNTAALLAINLETGGLSVVAESPRSDVSDVMAHPVTKKIEAVAFTYERKQWRVMDPAIEADLAYLRTVADGDVEVVSRTLDDQQWIVAYLMDAGPVRYYRYERPARKATFLFTHRKALEDLPLAKMHPVVIKSRDNLDLVSYLTLPLGTDPDGDARPAKPLPMVLTVHGGPWYRDSWGFHPWHQWLSNRGYAVLSVNFRGSTGFGKNFINAADGEWAGKMHDDLIDAVQWAIKERIADPKRIAIMGGSYGGFATLVGLTFTPDVFACGVDMVGPSNLVSFMEAAPPYWQPIIDMFARRIGDHRTEEGRAFLKSRSPLTRVDRIQRPLLIAQGANDPRVKQAESDQIVAAMQAKKIPVTYLLFPDEGHGFARPENNLAFHAAAEAFLAAHLGGRYEPVGDDFKGSSIEVRTGAAEVPGLGEALPKP